jgi:hypothetical protein
MDTEYLMIRHVYFVIGGAVNTTVLYYKKVTSFYNRYIFQTQISSPATKYKKLKNDGS